jgi:hypothetical protein
MVMALVLLAHIDCRWKWYIVQLTALKELESCVFEGFLHHIVTASKVFRNTVVGLRELCVLLGALSVCIVRVYT